MIGDMILVERDEHRTWKLTAYAGDKPPVTVRHLCGGMTAVQVGEMLARNSIGTLVLVADITAADIEKESRFPSTPHREPDYAEFEAELRAHDARACPNCEGAGCSSCLPDTMDV